ncbi:unnamed protein product, partial [Urochloa humidicola]
MPQLRRRNGRSGTALWRFLTARWLVGLQLLERASNTTTERLLAPQAPATHAEDLELGLAGGIRHIPPTLEVTAIFLNGLLQLVASFPFVLLCNKPKEAFLAALWLKLCSTRFLSGLLRLRSRLSLLQTITSPGQQTFLQRQLYQDNICILSLSIWALMTIQSVNWVWFLVLLFWFPTIQPTLQPRVKPETFRKILTKLIKGAHNITSFITNRLGRQPQGRRVTN